MCVCVCVYVSHHSKAQHCLASPLSCPHTTQDLSAQVAPVTHTHTHIHAHTLNMLVCSPLSVSVCHTLRLRMSWDGLAMRARARVCVSPEEAALHHAHCLWGPLVLLTHRKDSHRHVHSVHVTANTTQHITHVSQHLHRYTPVSIHKPGTDAQAMVCVCVCVCSPEHEGYKAQQHHGPSPSPAYCALHVCSGGCCRGSGRA